MKRSVFLLISAIVSAVFAAMLFFTPGPMMDGLGVTANGAMILLLRLIAVNTIIFGIMNFLARNDEGSAALRALMMGNILLHIGNIAIDWYGVSIGEYKAVGLIAGTVVHIAFGMGFIYYLAKTPAQLKA